MAIEWKHYREWVQCKACGYGVGTKHGMSDLKECPTCKRIAELEADAAQHKTRHEAAAPKACEEERERRSRTSRDPRRAGAGVGWAGSGDRQGMEI